MKKKLIIGVMISLFAPCLCAQNNQSLEKELEDALKKRCKETVDAYTFHVEYIADKKNSDKVKDDHIKTALEYFIGNGDGLKLLDDYGNPIMEDGAYRNISAKN